MENIKDELFGYLGLDSKYERDLVYYRPLLKYLKDETSLFPEIDAYQPIQRAELFPVYQVVYDYEELIEELDSMLTLIRTKENNLSLDTIDKYFKNKEYDEMFKYERTLYDVGNINYVPYYITGLFLMDTLSFRLDEVIEKFVSQYTSETNDKEIEKAERKSISEWKQLEQKSLTLEEDYENELIKIEEDESYEYNSVMGSLSEELDRLRSEKYDLHTTMADLGFIHRNRYFLLLQVIEGLYSLVESPMSSIKGNLSDLIYSIHNNRAAIPSMKAHLLISQKQAYDEYSVTEKQYTNYISQKESLANDKQFFYQQVINGTKSDIVSFLYASQEIESDSVNDFSEIMMTSLKSSEEEYDGILAETLNFYREEAEFYKDILIKIRKVEKMRAYGRICTELEDKDMLSVEWVTDYVLGITGE